MGAINTVSKRKMLFLLLALSISTLDSLSAAAKVTGFFGLEKHSFCIGEPIMLEFLVTNGSSSPYSYFVGGDYRGTLRHSRFSCSVQNEQGRDFTKKLTYNLGGLGGRITLKPTETYAEWHLLNAWTHLLPPGHYHVHCQTKLTDDGPLPLPPPTEAAPENSELRSEPVEIAQELEFDITNYDKLRILATVRQMKIEDKRSEAKPGMIIGSKPLVWAFDDLAEKFQTGIERTADENKFESDVLFALPWTWGDRYFAEYDLGYGKRNWISTEPYKDAWLKISVLNNSNQKLPLRFKGSSLFVNDVEVNDWQQRLKRAMEAGRIGDVVKAGALIEISIKCTDLLTNASVWKFVWNVDGFSKYTQIIYIEPQQFHPNSKEK
jgi:hypothetical protein